MEGYILISALLTTKGKLHGTVQRTNVPLVSTVVGAPSKAAVRFEIPWSIWFAGLGGPHLSDHPLRFSWRVLHRGVIPRRTAVWVHIRTLSLKPSDQNG